MLVANKTVHAIIVAKDIGDRLKYAVSITPEINAVEYEPNFKIQ
jgi:hypothetical protein